MPKGPQGQKRPADVVGNAVHVMRIATGEIEETTPATEGTLWSMEDIAALCEAKAPAKRGPYKQCNA